MATKMISNVSKIVHDKVIPNGPFKPFKYKCDNEVSSLSVNKDFTQVVVAGRTVFKILNIREFCFTDAINLRNNKARQDPVYVISDVTWHHSEENMLASAATNGSVVVWSISTKKKEVVFTDHKRSVNRVTFNGSEHNQLLSASQDGLVMIHDIRQQNPCITFGSSDSEIVKDAQFCPPCMGQFTFASAHGNGVQIWDTRRPDKSERQFVAHNGPVYTLDWHPTDRNLLATGGRDKMIKVWDLSVTNVANLYSITNIAPVANIKWRPHRKHHLASCYVQFDNSINVWDVNRPYIPFARFGGHDNTATCIQWRNDHQTFLTCGKDGNVIQHVFADAKRPADDLNLAATDISINSELGLVSCERNENSIKNKKQSRSHQFTAVHSSLHTFEKLVSLSPKEKENPLCLTEEEQFVHLAQKYQLDGSSFVDLCFHNSQVADAFNKHYVAECWRMLATTFCHSLSSGSYNHIPRTSSLSKSKQPSNDASMGKELAIKSALKHPRRKLTNPIGHMSVDNPDGTSGSNDESSEVDCELSEVDKNVTELNKTTSVLFGEGDMGGNSMVWNLATGHMLEPVHFNDESMNSIPPEAFRVRHELELKAMTELRPMVMDEYDVMTSQVNSDFDSVQNSDNDHSSHGSTYPLLIVNKETAPSTSPIDFTQNMTDMIKDHAERGDVQTVVTMLIVVGDAIGAFLDIAYQECWFFAYIDLLGQFELWQKANEVIKHSKLMGVSSLNQTSTVIHSNCSVCSANMERSAWLCDKCKRVTNLCSICHYPVKGSITWCQGCGHGGHKDHLSAWFEKSPLCPAGCGHECEYV